MSDLLPCPFCGGVHEAYPPQAKRVVCPFCGGAGPWGAGPLHAAEEWNRRTLPAVQPQMATPPFDFERYINGVLMAEGVCVDQAQSLDDAMRVAARIASRGPKGETPVLVYRAALAPTPDPVAAAAGVLLDVLNTPYSEETSGLTRDQLEAMWVEVRKHSGFAAVNAALRALAGKQGDA